MLNILQALGLGEENSGAWAGGRMLAGAGPLIESVNPASGERIATVRTAS
jgi:aldehyde dehydrogenase (NAD+)